MRLSVLVVVPVLGLGLAACGGGGNPPFAMANWQLRCPEGAMCSDSSLHRVSQFSGEPSADDETVTVRCQLVKLSSQTYVFDFTIQEGSGELHVQGLEFREGGSVQRCEEVTVTEEGAEFGTESCGSASPSGGQPCQFTNVGFETNMVPRRAVVGQLLCRNMPRAAEGLGGEPRHLTHGGDESRPVSFQLDGCEGL